MRPHLGSLVLMLGIMLFLTVLGLHEVIAKGNTDLSEEAGFIENATAFGFLFAFFNLLFLVVHKSALERALTLVFALSCLALLLREVDVEDFNVPHLVKVCGSGTGRDVLFLTAYAVLLGYMLIVFRGELRSAARSCLKSPVAFLVLAGCGCMLIGYSLDKTDCTLAEEILEMNGSLLIMLASIVHLREPLHAGEGAAADEVAR